MAEEPLVRVQPDHNSSLIPVVEQDTIEVTAADSDDGSAVAVSAPASATTAGFVDDLSQLDIEVIDPTNLNFCPVDDISLAGLRDFYQKVTKIYATLMQQLYNIPADATPAQRLAAAVSAPASASTVGSVDDLTQLGIEVIDPTNLNFCPVEDISLAGLRKFYQDMCGSLAIAMRQFAIVGAGATVPQRLRTHEEHLQRVHQILGFRGHVSTVTRRFRYEQAMLTFSAHSCSTLRVFRAFLN